MYAFPKGSGLFFIWCRLVTTKYNTISIVAKIFFSTTYTAVCANADGRHWRSCYHCLQVMNTGDKIRWTCAFSYMHQNTLLFCTSTKDRGLHNIPHCKSISPKHSTFIHYNNWKNEVIFRSPIHCIVKMCEYKTFKRISKVTNEIKTLVIEWLPIIWQPIAKRPESKCSWIISNGHSCIKETVCFYLMPMMLFFHDKWWSGMCANFLNNLIC